MAAATVARVTAWDATTLAALPDGAIARAIAEVSAERAQAEGELYRRFAPRVRLYGLRHLSDRDSAQDLAQQVMLVVIERLRAGEVRELDQIGSFILGTSRMMAGSLRRVDRRREGLRARYNDREEALTWTNERSLDETRIAPCLAGIRDRERTILLLSFYADKGAKEIAEALGMTAGAVRVSRHRALASMRECVEARRPS